MKINPDTYKNDYNCLFCGGKLDFVMNESFGEGVTLLCMKCKKRYHITNES